MKHDPTDKILALLSRKAGQSVRAQTKAFKKTLLANYNKEMSHAQEDARTIAG